MEGYSTTLDSIRSNVAAAIAFRPSIYHAQGNTQREPEHSSHDTENPKPRVENMTLLHTHHLWVIRWEQRRHTLARHGVVVVVHRGGRHGWEGGWSSDSSSYDFSRCGLGLILGSQRRFDIN